MGYLFKVVEDLNMRALVRVDRSGSNEPLILNP